VIDWFFGLLTPAQWEAWRNTLATLGGLIALLIAANTYRRNVRVKREEQARLVYSKVVDLKTHAVSDTFSLLPNDAQQGIGTPAMGHVPNPDPEAKERILGVALAPLIQFTATIHNGSKELIGPARVQMISGVTEELLDVASITLEAVEPETDVALDFTFVNEHHPGFAPAATSLIFRDASGQWWRRHRSEPIERVHDDPENSGPTANERVRIRQYQQTIGVPDHQQVKEPKLTVRVRWHRFLRRSVGKSPTP
jgi:hypothetical protein